MRAYLSLEEKIPFGVDKTGRDEHIKISFLPSGSIYVTLPNRDTIYSMGRVSTTGTISVRRKFAENFPLELQTILRFFEKQQEKKQEQEEVKNV